MKFFSTAVALATVIGSVSGVVRPGSDKPLFYLLSSSTTASANLLPVRMDGSLGGSSDIAKFDFKSGKLAVVDPAGSTFDYRPLVNSVPDFPGCSTYGQLGFTQGSSSNKCVRYDTFQIQSNPENSQLGAKLTFNSVGAFYACGLNVVYKVNPSDGPSGCNPIELWTVPVSPVGA